MLPFTLLENLLTICSVLFLLAAEVNSQTTSDDSQESNRFRSCAVSSYCTPIRRCPSLRDGWNRRGVGITCGYGIGPYRMVCCPRVGEEVPVRSTRRPTTVTPVPIANSENNEDCGLSQGMDWFQEHAMNDDTDALGATWPWMVAIRNKNSSGYSRPWCSGFLVDKTHVLSAAHCYQLEGNPERYTALIGSDDQDLAEEYRISEIKVHEGFHSLTLVHDIAILTLAREVNVSNFVPVCLPDDRVAAMDLTGWGTTLVGWGKETANGPISNTLKQLDDVPILTNEQCYQIFKEFLNMTSYISRIATDDQLCTGQTEGARDSCAGDSGGPVMILYRKRWIAVGLTSFGLRSCGQPGVPSVNIRLSRYVDWIIQNIENGSNLRPR